MQEKESFMVKFGERLKQLRIDQGMSQALLAVRLGVSKSLVSAYENGMRMPSYDVLISIANIFSVSTDYLLDVEPRSENERIDLSGLTSEEINALKSLIRAMRFRSKKV